MRLNLLKFITNIKSNNHLKNNFIYKDKYLNKRCFIIGNGPSLNFENLKFLSNEITFSVNSFTTTSLYKLIKPKFHVMVDPTRFDYKYPEFLNNLKEISEAKYQPVFIFPSIAFPVINEFGYDKKFKIIYINNYKKFPNKLTEIDITKKLPPYQNVLNAALYTAIYMGFKEIYLVGFDMTGFVKLYNNIKKDASYGGHFYDKEISDEKKVMDAIQNERKNEFMLYSYWKVFRLLRITKDFAVNKGINIYNCSKVTTLDTFEYFNLDNLIYE